MPISRWISVVLVLAGLWLDRASASELSWTPCHGLEMGGRLQAMCQACAGKGLGWRFYVSRDGRLTQCKRDPQAGGIYRQPWTEEDSPARREVAPARTAPRRETRPREESRTYARPHPPAAKPPATLNAPSSRESRVSHERSAPRHESHGTVHRPARPAEYKRASSPPSQPARQHERRKAEREK